MSRTPRVVIVAGPIGKLRLVTEGDVVKLEVMAVPRETALFLRRCTPLGHTLDGHRQIIVLEYVVDRVPTERGANQMWEQLRERYGT